METKRGMEVDHQFDEPAKDSDHLDPSIPLISEQSLRTPVSLTWKDVCYDVDVKSGPPWKRTSEVRQPIHSAEHIFRREYATK